MIEAEATAPPLWDAAAIEREQPWPAAAHPERSAHSEQPAQPVQQPTEPGSEPVFDLESFDYLAGSPVRYAILGLYGIAI